MPAVSTPFCCCSFSQLDERLPGLARHSRLRGLAGDGDAIPVVARVADDEDRDASGAGWGYPGCLQWWQPLFCYGRTGDDGVGDVLDVEGVCYCCDCEQ